MLLTSVTPPGSEQVPGEYIGVGGMGEGRPYNNSNSNNNNNNSNNNPCTR